MQPASPKPGGWLDRAAVWALLVPMVMVVVMVGGGGTEVSRVLLSIVATGVAFAVGRAALKLRQREGFLATFGMVGALCAALSLSAILLRNLFPQPWPAGAVLWRLAVASGAVAVLAADAGLLHAVRLRRGFDRTVRVLALLSMTLIALAVAIPALLQADPAMGGLASPIATMFGFFAIVSHLAVPVLGRMEVARDRVRRASSSDRALLTLQCPRCSLWMQMHSGIVACPSCRLALRVEFEEPRCACDYPLHRLQGDCCPECGRPIPAEQRWGRGAVPKPAPEAPSPSVSAAAVSPPALPPAAPDPSAPAS